MSLSWNDYRNQLPRLLADLAEQIKRPGANLDIAAQARLQIAIDEATLCEQPTIPLDVAVIALEAMKHMRQQRAEGIRAALNVKRHFAKGYDAVCSASFEVATKLGYPF